MSDKGADLNERVWRLFEGAGFQTKPSSHSPAEEIIWLSSTEKRTPDLSASDGALGVKIIGWNKDVHRLRESLTVHIHDYKELKRRARASSALFVSTDKEISPQQRQYAQAAGMRVWDEEDLRYYEALVDAIGEYAKYEIINSFGIETAEEKNIHNVLALRFRQPHSQSDTDLFLFTITPDKLLKTCVVLRKAQGSADAYQRMVRKARLSSIREFVTRGDALLPPNIIVHFGENVRSIPIEMRNLQYESGGPAVLTRKDYELVVLSIPLAYASLELIDGQHRLYGFARAEPATKENFNLAACRRGSRVGFPPTVFHTTCQ